jgi:hypothetical protein
MTYAAINPPVGKDYKALILFYVAILGMVAPASMIYVFMLGGDRVETAYMSFWAFDFAMYGMLLTPWLPLPSLKNHTSYDKLSLMVQIWVITYCVIALTFEIPWLLLYEEIAKAPNEMWSYTWMQYVDGGDKRYANPTVEVLFAETWACINAFIASIALFNWYKSGKTSAGSIYALMFCAGMHISPTAFYYVHEIAMGFPNVDTTAAGNFWAKFIISNSCWFWMPFVTFVWCTKTLPRLYTGKAA